MKLKSITIISIIVVIFLLSTAILIFQNKLFWNNQTIQPQETLPQNYQALLPKKSENPLGSGEEVSFTEAQRIISYPIPQLENEKIKQVWISINPQNPVNQSVAIVFKKDLLLIIHKLESEKPPNWDKTIAQMPVFKKINVNGNSGMGTEPGVTKVMGQPYSYPGSVEWWTNGLDITLYSDTLPLEELLKIAETVNYPSTSTALPTPTILFQP